MLVFLKHPHHVIWVHAQLGGPDQGLVAGADVVPELEELGDVDGDGEEERGHEVAPGAPLERPRRRRAAAPARPRRALGRDSIGNNLAFELWLEKWLEIRF